MGGQGSGRNWQCGKDTTDDCRALDVRRLQRESLLTAGLAFSWKWLRNGNTVASIQIRTEAQRLILIYRHQANSSSDWQQMEYGVSLDWTPCTYGGHRAWFRCPATGCGRRVALLYIGSMGVFACRHCYNLAYASQRKTLQDRLLRKAGKCRDRLKWKPGFLNPPEGKPKGMHWRTYWQLRNQHDVLAREGMGMLLAKMNAQQEKVQAMMRRFKITL
jgi:hypothetical protein